MNRPYFYSLFLLFFIATTTFASEEKYDGGKSSSQPSSTSSNANTHQSSSTKPSIHESTVITLAGCLAFGNDEGSTSKTSSENGSGLNNNYWSDFPSGH